MVILRTTGDELITNRGLFIDTSLWDQAVSQLKELSVVFLSIAMAALGLSINIKELKDMGYKPFVVGFSAAAIVGVVSIITITIFNKINLIL